MGCLWNKQKLLKMKLFLYLVFIIHDNALSEVKIKLKSIFTSL